MTTVLSKHNSAVQAGQRYLLKSGYIIEENYPYAYEDEPIDLDTEWSVDVFWAGERFAVASEVMKARAILCGKWVFHFALSGGGRHHAPLSIPKRMTRRRVKLALKLARPIGESCLG